MGIVWAIAGMLLRLTSGLVGRVLAALSMGYVSYTGFTATATWLYSSIQSSIGAMPAEVLSFLGWMWVDKAIGMLFSAYSAALFIKLAGGTSLTKLVTKGK